MGDESDRVTRVAYVNFPRFAERYRKELATVMASVVESGIYIGGPEIAEFERADRGWKPSDFPVSERRARMLLSLPLDPLHTDEEIMRVSASVRASLRRLRAA